MSVNSKMTAIADEIRTLSGATGTMGLDAMATNIGDANVAVSAQADLIAQITSALEGKAAGGSSVETCSMTINTTDFRITGYSYTGFDESTQSICSIVYPVYPGGQSLYIGSNDSLVVDNVVVGSTITIFTDAYGMDSVTIDGECGLTYICYNPEQAIVFLSAGSGSATLNYYA